MSGGVAYEIGKPLRARRALVRPAWNRLSNFGPLGEAHHLLLAETSGDVVVHRRGADLPGEMTQGLHLITAGWACRMRRMASGRRQIFLFLLPGDVIGSFCGRSESAFFRSVALTRLETVDVSGLSAVDGPEARALVEAGLRAEDQARGFLYDHLMRLGAGDAYSGMAHLLLELHDRLDRAGLVEIAGGFTLSVGQRVLAQALGVSVTHVNNTLQKMVADGLIAFDGRSVRLLQRERMAALADFDDVGAMGDGPVGEVDSSGLGLSDETPAKAAPHRASPTSGRASTPIQPRQTPGDVMKAQARAQDGSLCVS